MMRRREFITLVGGAAVSWPFGANTQQVQLPVIGFLNPTSSEGWPADRLRGFRQGLKEAGFIEGENVLIDYRWADNQLDHLPALAAELTRRRVAVIVTTAPGSAFAAKAATTATPIVFVLAEDPVRLGLVASLARPNSNLTGINFLSAELAAKRLELLREVVPAAARVAVLVNPANVTTTESTLRDLEPAASLTKLQLQILNAGTSREINAAFAVLVRERLDGLLVAGDSFFGSRIVQMVNLTSRHAVPAIFALREYAEAGGLMSYGANIADAFRQAGAYAGRILNGAKITDLPVLQSSKFELVINAETARMLNLAVPPALLARADAVIE